MIRRFKQVASSSTNSLDLAYRSISVLRRKREATSSSRHDLHYRGVQWRRNNRSGSIARKIATIRSRATRRRSSQSQDVRAIAMSAMPDIDYGSRLRAGVLIPSGNSVAEPEIRAMLPREVSMLVTRLALRGSSPTELMRMLDQLEAACGLLSDARSEE